VKRRILFVDDEPSVLAGLENLLRTRRDFWDTVFASSGDAALVELQSGDFDVVVSDMVMPGMDGAELLRRVKDRFPGVVRIVIAGQAERDLVLRALPVAHQFLGKPYDARVLGGVIDRACELQSLLANAAVRELVGRVDRLPSVPRAYWELIEALTRSEPDIRTVAGIIEKDAVMCAKILQLVNSAYFGLAFRTVSIEQAVMYLGTDLIKGLALTAHVFASMDGVGPIDGFSLEHTQNRALLTARISKLLLEEPRRADEAFTAGLVHDIGEVVLVMGARQAFAEAVRVARERRQRVHQVEKEIIGMTHAEVGAYLLGLWGLSFPIVEAAAYHHEPRRHEPETFGVLGAVHVADVLVDDLLPEPAGPLERRALDMAYLEAVGVTGEIPSWRAMVEELSRSFA
jgi:HD-like signal output (HDOD) protein